VLQRRKLAKKKEREKKKTNLKGHMCAAARGIGTWGEMKVKENLEKEGVGHGCEGARQNSGEGSAGS